MNFDVFNREIPLPDEKARQSCRERWQSLAKPLGGLGELENIICDIAALTCTDKVNLKKRMVVVMCADNGVVAEKVTQTASTTTALVASNIAHGSASIRHMARRAYCDVAVVDVGMIEHPRIYGLLDFSVDKGTKNIARCPAMTAEQALKAIENGIAVVKRCKAQGYNIIIAAEMGIGNTTTAAAMASVLLDKDSDEITGRGAGLSDEAFAHKREVVKKAIEVNKPDKEDVFDVLCKLGGFDIAAMIGLYIGGALMRVPVLVDGLISAVAAFAAIKLCPSCTPAVFATHLSAEPAAKLIFEAMGKKPFITAGMHLGEGTGAVCALPLLDMALAVYEEMSTFAQVGMDAYQDYSAK